MKDINKVKMGKHSRAQGKAFELKVRHDLEKLGWIVSKWSNNIELVGKGIINMDTNGKLISAKHTFNPFTKAISAGNGFPDFICIKYNGEWKVKLVESKITGKLDNIEKIKIKWLKDNLKIDIFVASKSKERGKINYEQQ